jgi:hypothetical protein
MSNWIHLNDLLNPFTFTLFFTIYEGTLKETLICPDVLSETVRFPISVISDVNILIMIDFSALAVLHRVQPLALVPISVR